ncbi:MAG: type II toxin-antitoxin system HicA family toxin [Nitrospirae bacterium]|nr:type II toxin-antitoxin system HicA family toxin [Nitrospirota bacterium]
MTPHFPAMTSSEVVAILNKLGFKFLRQSGSSHAIYKRASDGKRTTVPVHPGKILKRKTLKSIIEDTGLTVDEFMQLGHK